MWFAVDPAMGIQIPVRPRTVPPNTTPGDPMHPMARWLIALGLAGACFGAETGYWICFVVPILLALRITVTLEPRWSIEDELAQLLHG